MSMQAMVGLGKKQFKATVFFSLPLTSQCDCPAIKCLASYESTTNWNANSGVPLVMSGCLWKAVPGMPLTKITVIESGNDSKA